MATVQPITPQDVVDKKLENIPNVNQKMKKTKKTKTNGNV